MAMCNPLKSTLMGLNEQRSLVAGTEAKAASTHYHYIVGVHIWVYPLLLALELAWAVSGCGPRLAASFSQRGVQEQACTQSAPTREWPVTGMESWSGLRCNMYVFGDSQGWGCSKSHTLILCSNGTWQLKDSLQQLRLQSECYSMCPPLYPPYHDTHYSWFHVGLFMLGPGHCGDVPQFLLVQTYEARGVY